MKKYICMIFVLFAVSLISKAETVDAVYFNPSRLGRYEMLKISDTLTAAGDIQAGSMSIQTGNKATITADSYTIKTINASGSISMPNTEFIANRMSVLRGGKATFGKEDSVSSIDDLYDTEFIKTGTLDAVRVGMYITGDKSVSDLDGKKPLALRLGTNNIPVPPSECTNLQFVERKADDGKKYKVLACTNSAACTGTKPATTREGPEGSYCEQSRTVTCNTTTGKWTTGDWRGSNNPCYYWALGETVSAEGYWCTEGYDQCGTTSCNLSTFGRFCHKAVGTYDNCTIETWECRVHRWQ